MHAAPSFTVNFRWRVDSAIEISGVQANQLHLQKNCQPYSGKACQNRRPSPRVKMNGTLHVSADRSANANGNRNAGNSGQTF
jgi:hypothetical protein